MMDSEDPVKQLDLVAVVLVRSRTSVFVLRNSFGTTRHSHWRTGHW